MGGVEIAGVFDSVVSKYPALKVFRFQPRVQW